MPEIPIELVTLGHRVRGIDESRVTVLMASIGEVGLMHPITVAPYKLERDGSVQNGWILISGLHRLEAMARLGHLAIAAIVTDLHGPLAVIAECDENLCGSNLSFTERALFTKRRKAAYLELHPETAAHVAGAHAANRSMGHASANLAPAFTADAAAKTSQPERTIQRDARRGEKIPEEILQRIVRTPLDKGAVLDRLSKAESPERELDIIEREGKAKKASPRERSASNRAPQEQTPVLSTIEPQEALIHSAQRPATVLHGGENHELIETVESGKASISAAAHEAQESPESQTGNTIKLPDSAQKAPAVRKGAGVPQPAKPNGDQGSHDQALAVGLFGGAPLPSSVKNKEEITEAARCAKLADREQARENSRQFAQLLMNKIDQSQWRQVIVWLGHCSLDDVIAFIRQRQLV